MEFLYLLPIFVAIFDTTLGYANGPPMYYPNICEDMFPHGHNATAQTVAPPFEVVTSQSCYKHGSVIQVRIRITDKAWYFEGFFVQGRQGMDNTTAYGTFDKAGLAGTQELACFSTSKSAIAHSEKKHYWVRTFSWTAPSSGTANLHLKATLVKNEKTFWVGVMSPELVYNSTCTTGTTLAAESFSDLQPGSSHEDTSGGTSSAVHVLGSVILLLATFVCTRL